MEAKSTTTISISASDLETILKDYFGKPNGKVTFVIGTDSDRFDSYVSHVLARADLVFERPLEKHRTSFTQSSNKPDNIENDR